MLSGLFDLYRDMRYSVNPRFELELAVSRLCAIRDFIPPAEISRTVNSLKQALVEGKTPGAVAVGTAFRDAMKAAGSAYASQDEVANDVPASQEDAASPVVADVVIDSTINQVVENPSYPQTADSENPDVAAVRSGVIQALGRNRMVLTTCLQRSGDWKIVGGHLLVTCANAYDANTISSESNIISKKVLELFGLALRVDAKAIEVPREAPAPVKDDDEGDEDGDDGPADPVEIVERVFRGRRIPSRQSDGDHRHQSDQQ